MSDSLAPDQQPLPGTEGARPSARELLRQRMATRVRAERVTLSGEPAVTVEIRGLTLAEAARIEAEPDARRRAVLYIAHATYDPDTGRRIWDPADPADLEEIGQLPDRDAVVLLEAAIRVARIEDPTPPVPSPSSPGDGATDGATP